ncbi:MAG: type II toxin-antitoxin system Phd/YefM family antitoxin [Oscillospiraceae bacterium]|jgi:PHD/YefM family antitoxin component YafN of YafNO toxin-antitoxin module|nr:type II toxin-antitoxin system Phd/YefM family antitoxin [Oscillospiraceae bacterium]
MAEINMTDFIGNVSQIAERVGRNGQPVVIRGNGFGDLVLIPRADYESHREAAMVFGDLCDTLDERASEAKRTDRTVSHDTVMKTARDIIGESYRRANV